MDTFTQGVSIAGGILAIIILLIGALVFIKGSYNKARIQALREDNEDLRARIMDQERELVILKATKETHTTQIQHLEAENQLLANMITQRANVEALSDLLEMHHKESLQAWKNIQKAIERQLNEDS